MNDSKNPQSPSDGRDSASFCALGCKEAISAGQDEVAFRWCIQLSDDLLAMGPERLGQLVGETPPLTGDIRYDSLIAAIVESACEGAQISAPPWVSADTRIMGPDAKWYPADLWYLHEEALGTTQPIFRAHGVIILPSEFESV